MKFLIVFAFIAGFASASLTELPHGFSRTVINGPSGSIVQETPAHHTPVAEVYAPAYPASVAVPAPVLPAPVLPAPVFAEPAPVYGGPAVPVPAPIIAERALPYAPAFARAIPEPFIPAPLPAPLPVPASVAPYARAISEPFVAAPEFHSFPAPAPALYESRVAVPAQGPYFESRSIAAPLPVPAPFYTAPAPVFAERFLPPSYAVEAPQPVFAERAFAPVPVASPEPVFAGNAGPARVYGPYQ